MLLFPQFFFYFILFFGGGDGSRGRKYLTCNVPQGSVSFFGWELEENKKKIKKKTRRGALGSLAKNSSESATRTPVFPRGRPLMWDCAMCNRTADA